uniref:Uncharacterized protein n=1 Tax=Trypanosoma congolense (strain IL3000) TaxID=1068625 RepID=G0UU43_TRYCI|nr:conserved hypothetical protein [Trypanosoma congolense IL3000]
MPYKESMAVLTTPSFTLSLIFLNNLRIAVHLCPPQKAQKKNSALMPQLFAEAGRRKFVSPFTRLRAWWMGLDDAELLSRYGESGLCRAMWVRWRGTIVAVACASVMFINMSQSNRANEILDNIELNRRRYYKRDFVPEYVSNAPEAVYDGPKGYSYRDEVSGIMINADGRLTSDLSREERRAQLDGAQISSGMLEAARKLRQSARYQ